ncbi:MAG: UbiA family prenyltransferase [Bacteroidota bacterium]
MRATEAFIRMLRTTNLLIVAFTMYAMRFGVLPSILHSITGQSLQLSELDFFLSVLVMVLLAAAGNLINDYFDVRADRINKPERVMVGKHIKRRVVMAAHHVINVIAVGIGFYLAFRYNQLWIGFVPVVMAGVLWMYSLTLKKNPFAGNITVALLIAVVPLWAGVFEIPLLQKSFELTGGNGVVLARELWMALGWFSGFAFLLTLLREIIKDAEDLEGDRAAGFKTLAVVWSSRALRNLLHVLYFLSLMTIVAGTFFAMSRLNDDLWRYLFPLMAGASVFLPFVFSWYHASRAERKNGFTEASKWLKVGMAGGIMLGALMPFWFLG